MAVQAAIFCFADENITPVSVNAGASSAEIFIGSNRRFLINATQDITIARGTSGMGAATANFFRLVSGTTYVLDLGPNDDRIRVFNLGASAATVYIQGLAN